MSESSAIYTHGHHDSVVRTHASRTAENSARHLLPELRTGMRILDLGSGPGTITLDLARLVGPAGHVLGIEASSAMVEQSTAAAAAAGLDNVEFRAGDAMATGEPDDSFDVVHAHQVLQHVGDPIGLLREMRRVAVPGGIVTAREVIYSSTSIWPMSEGLADWKQLVVAVQDANGGEADAGSHLKAGARAAGFVDVRTDADTWVYETDATRQWWGLSWAERAVASSFATSAIEQGRADEARLEQIADAWRAWTADDDGWFAMLHGWIIARA